LIQNVKKERLCSSFISLHILSEFKNAYAEQNLQGMSVKDHIK